MLLVREAPCTVLLLVTRVGTHLAPGVYAVATWVAIAHERLAGMLLHICHIAYHCGC